jgi:ATP-dependent Clp protease ATP-binding subunit ClpX
MNQRMHAASIGFGTTMEKDIDDAKIQGQYFDNAFPNNLVKYGMIPEFVGRFPVITTTKGLNLKNVVDILTKPKNSIMKQYLTLFAMDDVNFFVTKDALKEIAETAFSRGTGARGLRSIADSVLMDTQYAVPSLPTVHTVYVDAAAVRGESTPMLFHDPNLTVQEYEALVQDGVTNIEGAVTVNIEDLEASFSSEEAAA